MNSDDKRELRAAVAAFVGVCVVGISVVLGGCTPQHDVGELSTPAPSTSPVGWSPAAPTPDTPSPPPPSPSVVPTPQPTASPSGGGDRHVRERGDTDHTHGDDPPPTVVSGPWEELAERFALTFTTERGWPQSAMDLTSGRAAESLMFTPYESVARGPLASVRTVDQFIDTATVVASFERGPDLIIIMLETEPGHWLIQDYLEAQP